MHLEIADRSSEDFIGVGDWFLSFVELGKRLGELSLLDRKQISRLVIGVPNRDLVAAAIAFGISINRFSIQDDLLVESGENSKIPVGVKLRLEWPTRVVVGRFVKSELLIRGADTFLKMHLTVNGAPDTRSVKLVSAIKLAPEGLPEGIYENSTVMNPIQLGWERQALPGAIVFGDAGFWKNQMELQIKSDQFPGLVAKETARLYEICRMDQLTPVDKFPHFINVYEKTTQFPDAGTPADEVMKSVLIAIFDGNAAIDVLFDKRRLESNILLGVLETGALTLQDQAIERIKNATSHLDTLENVSEILGWQPPGRCVLMGWKDGK